MNEFKDYTGKKVLYIDDEMANLIAGEAALANFKLEVHTKNNLSELSELVKVNEYDLIILDDVMPEHSINGTTAMQRLRTSGYTKPIDLLKLTEAIKEVLNK